MATIGAKCAQEERCPDRTLTSPRKSTPAPSRSPSTSNGKDAGLAAPCSRTRPTTTPPRSSPSAARPPASAAAIRDPLSGRAYVYQAMRVTGCGDPRDPGERDAARQAAPAQARHRPPPRATPPTATRSAWPPAMVGEVYHPGYVAKRLEVGAVVGAAPADNVVRGSARPRATW